MATGSMIQAFSTLPTNSSRREAIEALVQELTPYEWRHVQTIVNTRSFQCDIVGSLPVELAAQIFAYLDTTTKYRLQLVSKRWATLLRSPDVLKPDLRQWYGSTIDFRDADYAFCLLKSRHAHALRNGNKPSSCFKIRNLECLEGQDILLAEDTLIWLSGSPYRTLNVLNIRAWTYWKMNGKAREQLYHTALSEELVMCTSSRNTCYVSTLDGQERKNFKVANREMFNGFECRGRTVACAGFLKDSAMVYIWNFDSQQGRSFEISLQHSPSAGGAPTHREPRNLALLLDPKTQTVVVFSIGRCPGAQPSFISNYDEHGCTVHYSRFTFSGQCIRGDDSITLPYSPDTTLIRIRPVDRNGRYALDALAQFPGVPDVHAFSLQFDEHLDKFISIDHPGPSLTHANRWTESGIAWWEDAFYRVSFQKSATRIEFTHLRNSDPTRPKTIMSNIVEYPQGTWTDVIPIAARVLLNEKYVVFLNTLNSDGPHITVCCFDDRVNHPLTSESFFGVGAFELA